MPNWCMSTITFNGEPKDIKKLYDFIKDDKANDKLKLKSDFGTRWLGNYLERAGFDYDEYRCRGSLDYYGDIEDEEVFSIQTETAWRPMLQMWKAICDKIAPSVEIIYNAEEPGAGMYITNDPAIAGNYWVDVYDDDLSPKVTGVFGSSDNYEEADLRKALLEIFPKKRKLSTDDLINVFEEAFDGITINKWELVGVDECN